MDTITVTIRRGTSGFWHATVRGAGETAVQHSGCASAAECLDYMRAAVERAAEASEDMETRKEIAQ